MTATTHRFSYHNPFTADLNGDGNDDLIVLGIDYALSGAPVNAGDGTRTRPTAVEASPKPTRSVAKRNSGCGLSRTSNADGHRLAQVYGAAAGHDQLSIQLLEESCYRIISSRWAG